MKDHFPLCGPQEGRSTDATQDVTQNTNKADNASDTVEVADNAAPPNGNQSDVADMAPELNVSKSLLAQRSLGIDIQSNEKQVLSGYFSEALSMLDHLGVTGRGSAIISKTFQSLTTLSHYANLNHLLSCPTLEAAGLRSKEAAVDAVAAAAADGAVAADEAERRLLRWCC